MCVHWAPLPSITAHFLGDLDMVLLDKVFLAGRVNKFELKRKGGKPNSLFLRIAEKGEQ